MQKIITLAVLLFAMTASLRSVESAKATASLNLQTAAEAIPNNSPAVTTAPGQTETPEQREARLKWFREARFGLFIHWGVYSVPAGLYKDKEINGIGEWIMNRGKIPVADYRAFAKDFTASKYDPTAWAKLAKEAGMKYVIITSKHHDGFALYDSKVSDWNAVKASGAKRDLITPLAKAVRDEGLKFGLYYSQAQDWNNPGGAAAGGHWDPAQEGDYDQYLKNFALPQVDEILTRFHPSVIWWDTPKEMTPERVAPFAQRISREIGLISNNRLGKGFDGDTQTPERKIPPRGYPGKLFEVCMTMNETWGYKANDNDWKSVRVLVQQLSDIASKGGNFLLNIGPTCEGVIPAPSVERLQALGRWMKINSEAIYATEAGPFVTRQSWGRATRKATADGGETLYLHVWEWPADGKLLLKGIAQPARAGKMLADGAPLNFTSTPEGLVVTLPGAARDPDVSVAAVQFAKPIVLTNDGIPAPGAHGSIELGAIAADCEGHFGNIVLEGVGKEAFLTKWNNAAYTVSYTVKTPTAQRWTVRAEVRAEQASKLSIKAGKSSLPTSIAPTGNAITWKTVELGIIDLPAGETSFQFVPEKNEWKPIELKTVWLIPLK